MTVDVIYLSSSFGGCLLEDCKNESVPVVHFRARALHGHRPRLPTSSSCPAKSKDRFFVIPIPRVPLNLSGEKSHPKSWLGRRTWVPMVNLIATSSDWAIARIHSGP